MNNQNSLQPKSKKFNYLIGIGIAILLLLLIFIVAVIGGVIYWHWTTHVNS